MIWALDPQSDPAHCQQLLKEMKKWADAFNGEIQPVSVLSNSIMDFPYERIFKTQTDFYQHGIAQIQALVDQMPGSNLLPPKVLFSSAISNRRKAMGLVQYSQRERPFIVFALSRGRGSLSHRFGGFVEGLMEQLRAPLLIMNQEATSSANLKRIFYPTDLSHRSRMALNFLTSFVQPLHSQITLFNQLQKLEMDAFGFTAHVPRLAQDFEEALEEAKRERALKLETFASFVKQAEIPCTSRIVEQNESLSESILEESKSADVDLIAMSVRGGRSIQNTIGGTARDIVIHSQRPILLLNRVAQYSIGLPGDLPFTRQLLMSQNSL